MIELGGNHPLVKAAARALEITVILRAWKDDEGTIFIQDPWGTYEVAPDKTDTRPVPAGSRVDTLPRGSDQPAPTHTEPSDPPQGPEGSSTHNAVDRETDPGRSAGLDDFTAISGVGSSYAQDLHDAGLFTYQDLREWKDTLEEIVPAHTAKKIHAWLQERLC